MKIKDILSKFSENPKLRIFAIVIAVFIVLIVIYHHAMKSNDASINANSQMEVPEMKLHKNAFIDQKSYDEKNKTFQENKYQAATNEGNSYMPNLDFSKSGENDSKMNKNINKKDVSHAVKSNQTTFNADHDHDGNISETESNASHVDALALNKERQKQTQAQNVKNSAMNSNAQESNGEDTRYQNDMYSGLAKPTGSRAKKAVPEVSITTDAMQANAQQLMQKWSASPSLGVVKGIKPKVDESKSAVSAANLGSVMIKAGDILYAVIDTSVNSDQPGTPVRAKIVTGKYKGTILLGGFVREQDKVVVSFTLMSGKQFSSSLPISAYAINGKTAQTAMASDVDHHYLTRFGSLFAASFLQGFGTYFSQNTATICINPGNCIGVDQQARESAANAAYAGVGQVGTQLSNSLASEFNRPPTVTLNQGTTVGILFMKDVSRSTK